MKEKNEKQKGKFKQSFTNRRFKLGAYQSIITVVVLVVVVVLNLMVTKMNITVDLSSDSKYTLTDETKNMVKKLQDKIKLYYMVQEGNETDMVQKVVEQYEKLGGNLAVETKDPIVYPTFAKQYTEDDIADNDLIVVDETNGKSQHVKMEDMVPSSMNYQTYQTTYETLDAEGQITAAIQTVTSTESYKLYITSGHNEQAVADSFKELLSKSNMTVEEVRTDSWQEIPSDCDYILMNGPQYDLSDAEYSLLKSYLENGGKAFFFLNSEAKDSNLDNYYKLLKDYGVDVKAGYVVESQENCVQSLTVVKPSVETHDITADVSDTKPVLFPITKGLDKVAEVRSTLTVEPLFTSSDASFSRVNSKETSTTIANGDIAGPFTLAQAVTDTYRDKTTKLVVFGSYEVANESFVSSEQYGNRSVLLNALNWMSDSKTESLSIPTRSIAETYVEVGSGDRIFWSVVLVGVIPIGFLIGGFVIWYRRRRS